jgi:NDP-sugar pyrophosphorylase family protein
MHLDSCLILAAGFGTRMGSIGKELPKVLWPVFEKSLLELQVLYAKKLGINKIFINIHHQKDIILKHVDNSPIFNGVTILEEEEILDIGGAIHNLASQKQVGYQGNLLVLNADQFFWLEKKQIENELEILKNSVALLFNYNVNSSNGYNAVTSNENKCMTGIIKNAELQSNMQIQTYTGMSLINLAKLKPTRGVSNFFDSVATFKTSNVHISLIDKPVYWDFGTSKRYWDSMFLILDKTINNKIDSFINFLLTEKALVIGNINHGLKSYNSQSKNVINLTHSQLNIAYENKIYLKLELGPKNISNKSEIIYNDVVSGVDS